MSTGVRRFTRWIEVISFVLLLQACTSLAYLPGQQTVGRLRTVGPNVYINDKRARDGQMVRVTDRLRTGPSSSVFLYPLDGGLIQLDENTHPFFKLVWVGGRCRIVTLGLRVGQAYQETGHQCGTTVRTSQGEWTQQEIRNRISYRGPTE
jgi:hypothetical protein